MWDVLKQMVRFLLKRDSCSASCICILLTSFIGKRDQVQLAEYFKESAKLIEE